MLAVLRARMGVGQAGLSCSNHWYMCELGQRASWADQSIEHSDTSKSLDRMQFTCGLGVLGWARLVHLLLSWEWARLNQAVIPVGEC